MEAQVMAGLNWVPYSLVTDTHGRYIHVADAKAFHEHMRVFKPKKRAHLGDWHDATCLRTGAGPQDLGADYGEDYTAAKQFIDTYKPTDLFIGNHDARLWRLLDHPNAIIREFAGECVNRVNDLMRRHKCRLYPYSVREGIGNYGDLQLLHGFHYGENAVRKHAEVFGTCAMGHIHRIEQRDAVRAKGSTCYSIGHLSDDEAMTYCEHKTSTLRWQRGWAVGAYNNRTGDYQLWQVRKIGGKWCVPGEVTWI
jgi:hypothetical protein